MKLTTNPANPRTITKDAYDKLKRSIERNPDGLTANKIAHKDGIIISGNQRYRAIQELKLDMKPEWFKDLSGWTQEQIDEWVIQSNLSAGEWDWDELANGDWLATDLNDWGLDTTQEWDNKKELPETIDDIPEPPKDPITKLGDIWLLGNHRVICGDSTDKTTVERLMDGKKADMVFTDPPYGIGIDGQKKSTAKNPKQNRKAHEFREWDRKRPSQELFDLILSLDCETVIFGGNYFADLLPPTRGWIYWDKGQNGLTMSDGELAWTNIDQPLRAFVSNRANIGDSVHPTQKPVNLVTFCLEKAKQSQTVLDLFLGSGSTLIACEQTDRLCYGLELDPHYVDVICKRWQTLTGELPILESTGEAHDFIG